MTPGGTAAWELRVPPYRVYYDVDIQRQEVQVQAIGRKPREVVTLLGSEN